MKHYGDITKIHGDQVEPVDIITGGSPCQDLSVAGNRDGLSGERSGLFMEQVRIVKEMREKDVRDKGRSPRLSTETNPNGGGLSHSLRQRRKNRCDNQGNES